MKQHELIEQLKQVDDNIQFKPANTYYWSPKEKTVYYQADDSSEVGLWTLLHETCHGLLEHKTYTSDFELVTLELAAWKHADELADTYALQIDQDHVQDCLDSYRDWQYKRSLCPRCDLGGMQIDTKTYRCLFCAGSWHVSEARFCRPYRRKA